MDNKLPTAEEFLYNAILKDITENTDIPEQYHKSAAKTISGYRGLNKENVTARAMIEFAKLHRKAIIDEIYEKGLDGLTTWDGNPYTGEGSDYLDKELLLKAYPEDLIK